MTKLTSLDELIAKKAVEYAEQIRAAAAMADNEEEVKIESENQLAFIQKEAGIKLERKFEYTVASGRVDSVYSRVIIEYKNPKSPGDRIGPKADSPGSKKVVEQIKKRFYDMKQEHGQPLTSLFGVGLDGNHFIFVRFRDDKWHVNDPVEVNGHTAERFLWALFNLGTKGKPFSPEYLAGDFGSEGGNTVAINGIHALYEAIVVTDNPKAQTFFTQWKVLFGEVCGYDVDHPSDKLKKLAAFYKVSDSHLKPAQLLFAVHTYYALFMKLLASEIVAFFHKLPTPLQKMMQATTSTKLRREMDDLEAGSIFRHLNVTNFLEGDLFAWYTAVWSDSIEKLVREMVARLDNYNPGTLSEDPTGSRDLLKNLYQQLFPKSVRHDLGEYYTPDWLADHVLNELSYVGDPDKRLLDPACGSGTFLVMAINRIRDWFEKNRETCRFDEGDLCRKILDNVVGFDLNPLAVMAARTNYLIAIRGLIGYGGVIEIPVYLCDAVMTPAEYGDLFTGSAKVAKIPCSACRPPHLLVPKEVARSRSDIAKYAQIIEQSLLIKRTSGEFIEACRDDSLPITDGDLHRALYAALLRLDEENKNGVWARMIKNAFAPLFLGKVDYIAGNPPWVFWNNLPEEYRLEVRKLMGETYGLIKLKASKMGRLGQTGKDISMLFVYVCLDQYLREGGKLGFVITQTVFQSTAGEEFRRFMLPSNVPFKIAAVHDMVAVNPFVLAVNRTATFSAIKGSETEYPVPYTIWSPRAPLDVANATLDEVLGGCALEKTHASPSSYAITSPWIVGVDGRETEQKTRRPSGYRPRKGLQTGAEGIFKIKILKKSNAHSFLICNDTSRSKRKVDSEQGVVARELIYPFCNGASTQRWCSKVAGYYLVPHTLETGMEPVAEREMKHKFSSTFEYLAKFKEVLAGRAIHKQWGSGHPFYSVYNIGPYTFAPWKIIWRRISNEFAAAVISTVNDANLGERLLIPNESLMLINCEEEVEALFICAALNSSLARYRINRSITLQIHSEVLEIAAIPRFERENSLHRELAAAASKCHKAAQSDEQTLREAEMRLDELACGLWKSTKAELRRAQAELEG